MRRVLIVDDDALVLKGLQRGLRKLRGSWEMTFVNGGDAALEALAAEPFDVIVSDMRMPGMDGANLLRTVHDRHEEVVRIILSGSAEGENAAKAIHVAHQFLSKPCATIVLERTVQRACALRERMTDPALLRLIGRIDRLPPVPKTYQALVREVARPNASATSVAAIIEQDSAISAKLLQVVSSAFFVTMAPTRSISGAVMRLGFAAIRDLCLGMEAFGGDAIKMSAAALETHQRHSIDVGRLAAACFEDPGASQEAFMAGMLHDLGEIIVASTLPLVWKELTAKADTAELRRELELSTLHATHDLVGAYLLSIWGLPYDVVSAVAHHHRPTTESGTHALTLAVHVADAVVEAGSVSTARDLLDPNLGQHKDLATLAATMLNRISIAEKRGSFTC